MKISNGHCVLGKLNEDKPHTVTLFSNLQNKKKIL